MSRDPEGERELEALTHYHRALRQLEAATLSWSQGLGVRVRVLIGQAIRELDQALELLRPS